MRSPVSNSTEQKPVAQPRTQPRYLSVDECARKRGIYAQHSFIQLYRKLKLDLGELENLMLNEIGESHNENYCVFSHVCYLGDGEKVKVEGQ